MSFLSLIDPSVLIYGHSAHHIILRFCDVRNFLKQPFSCNYACIRLTSAINTGFVSSFFDAAIGSMLSSQASSVTQEADAIDATTSYAPESSRVQSSPLQVESSKGFGPPSASLKSKASKRASVSGAHSKKKASSEVIPSAAIVKAVSEKMAAASAARSASLETALEIDALLDSLVAPIFNDAPSQNADPLASEGLPDMPLLKGVSEQLDRLARTNDKRPGGPSSSPAVMESKGSMDISGNNAPSPPTSSVIAAANKKSGGPSSPPSALDLLGDLEDLLFSEEADARRDLPSSQEADVQRIISTEYTISSSETAAGRDQSSEEAEAQPAGAGVRTGLAAPSTKAARDQRRPSRPQAGSIPGGSDGSDRKQDGTGVTLEDRIQKQQAAELSDLNRRLEEALLVADAASAEAARLSAALAVREASALKASGLAGSVMARLVALEALSSSDKMFFSQSLNQMMAILLEPHPTEGDATRELSS